MNHGLKKRLQELNLRNSAAAALGHGILDCPTQVQAKIAEILLQNVQEGPARLDIFLAMHNQGISTHPSFRTEYEVEVNKDQERRLRQADNARLAREEQAAFRAWKSGRQQHRATDGSETTRSDGDPQNRSPSNAG